MDSSHQRKILGQQGERFASHYAESVLKWRVLECNARFKCGEIDVIFLDERGRLVFVEVKTRRGLGFGSAVESLTPQKVLHFKRACIEWLRRCPVERLGAFRMECFAVQIQKGVWKLQRFEIE